MDLGLPPVPHRPDEGFRLISELIAHRPDMKILVLSGQSDESNARYARTLGAIEFIAKPCDPARLLELLQRRVQWARRKSAAAAVRVTGIIGDGPAIQKLHQQITQYAARAFSGADRRRIGKRQGIGG